MQDKLRESSAPETLDRASWHRPLVSIIMTHFNYSGFIRDAILSVLDQTHENWEMVVIDDASSPEHRQRLEGILSDLDDDRISSVFLPDNLGQILAFYAGFERTKGNFVCLLDPDDRYAPTFLEESLSAHLNAMIACPISSTDQYLISRNGLLSGTNTLESDFRGSASSGGIVPLEERWAAPCFIPSSQQGWHWTSTSAMMFRRAALACLQPDSPLPFKNHFDAYAAQGAHLLGGSIFIRRPLVYRLLHEQNDWHTDHFYSSLQRVGRSGVESVSGFAQNLAREVLSEKGIDLPRSLTKLSTPGRWKRSIMKRLPKRWK